MFYTNVKSQPCGLLMPAALYLAHCHLVISLVMQKVFSFLKISNISKAISGIIKLLEF